MPGEPPPHHSPIPANGPPASTGNVGFILRAFRSRNYRLYFIGQLVSMMGTWLTIVATSWLVYRLAQKSMPHRAAAVLGLVNFAAQIPITLFTPFAGVWVDRLKLRSILLFTQSLSMLQSFALAFLALRDVITIPQVIALQAFQGVVNALDVPTRQSMVIELVENRDDLPNAIALSSSIVHAARLVGPAVAGYLIYALKNEGWCFLLDGVSYFGVLIALLMMRVKPRPHHPHAKRVLHSLKEGFAYSFGFAPMRALLLLVALTSLVAMSLSTLMPVFAADVLHGGERTLGLLYGASGVGAFCGTMYLASRRSVLGLGRVIAIANAALGMGMIGFAFSRTLGLSLPILCITGGAMVVQMAAANTVLQTIVEDDKRGRVNSIFSLCFMGVTPFGSLLAGRVADLLGAPRTVLIGGLACAVGGAIFGWRLNAMRPLVRPIYRARGVMPEVAEGVQSTASAAAAAQEG